MSVERGAAINSVAGSNDEQGNHQAQESYPTVAPHSLKIAQRPVRNRVQRLLDLADSLLKQTEALALDQAFAEETNRFHALNLAAGIDFYNEVERFETSLIRLALDQTRGHQAQAAKLLNIKPTTLNSKIKLYGIEY